MCSVLHAWFGIRHNSCVSHGSFRSISPFSPLFLREGGVEFCVLTARTVSTWKCHTVPRTLYLAFLAQCLCRLRSTRKWILLGSASLLDLTADACHVSVYGGFRNDSALFPRECVLRIMSLIRRSIWGACAQVQAVGPRQQGGGADARDLSRDVWLPRTS